MSLEVAVAASARLGTQRGSDALPHSAYFALQMPSLRCDKAHQAMHSQQAQAVPLYVRILKQEDMIHLQQRIQLCHAVPWLHAQPLAGVGCWLCRPCMFPADSSPARLSLLW